MWYRSILKILSLLMLTVFSFMLLIIFAINLSFARNLLVKQLNLSLQNAELPIQIAALNRVGFTRINASGILIHGIQGDTIAYLEDLSIRFSPVALFKHKLKLMSCKANHIILRLHKEKSGHPLNITEAFGMTDPVQSNVVKKKRKPWSFDIKHITLRSLSFQYHSLPDSLFAGMNLGEGNFRIKAMDLAKKIIEIRAIDLDQAIVMFNVADKPGQDPDSSESFSFPWNIETGRILLSDCAFKTGKYNGPSGNPDISQFVVSDIQIRISDIRFNNDQISFKFRNTEFFMSNGFRVRNFDGDLESDASHTRVDIHLETNNSLINLKGNAGNFILDLFEDPGDFVLNIGDTKLALSDMLFFEPELQRKPWFEHYNTTPLNVNFSIKNQGNITLIKELKLEQAKNLRLSIHGQCTDLFTDIKPTKLDLRLLSNYGNLALTGAINIALKSYHLTSEFRDLNITEVIGREVIDKACGSFKINGNGFSTDKLYANFSLTLDSILFKEHNYDKVSLSGNITPSELTISARVEDTSLTCRLQSVIYRDQDELSLQTTGSFNALLHELDLQTDTLTVKGNFKGKLLMSDNRLSAGFELSETGLASPGNNTTIKLTKLFLESDKLHTRIDGHADFFDLDFTMEGSWKKIDTLLLEMNTYFRAQLFSFFLDSTFNDFRIPDARVDLQIRPHPIINLMLGDTGLSFAGVDLQVRTNKRDRLFFGKISATGIQNGDLSVENFHVLFKDSARTVNFSADAGNVTVASNSFSHVGFSNRSALNEGLSRIIVEESLNKKNSEIMIGSRLADSILILTIPDRQILINGFTWQTHSTELFSYNRNRKAFLPHITLYSDNATLVLVTIKSNGQRGFDVRFNHVPASSLFPVHLLAGNPAAEITGTILYRSPESENMSVTVDLQLNHTRWSDLDFERLDINGSYFGAGSGTYKAHIDIAMDSALITIKGDAIEPHDRKFAAEFTGLPLNVFAPFLKDVFSGLSGTASGNFTSAMKNDTEKLDGIIKLNHAKIKVTALNSLFTIPGEMVTLSGRKIMLDGFRILDSLNNELFVNGYVDLSPDKTVNTSLDISSPKLQVMNSSKKDNASFYGTIFIGTQLRVNGPVSSPRINGKISLTGGTEVFFTSLASYELQDMNNTVSFVNMANPDDPLHITKTQNLPYRGSSIRTTVDVDPETRIHISLPDQLYDINLTIQGGGLLNYNVSTGNHSHLSGLYEVKEGDVDLKIRGWGNKNFRITGGSIVRWTDKMDDPELEIEALNTVTGKYTNPSERRERIINFNVVLQLTGRLSELDVVFTVTTPDQYLMSIINTMSPEERMKQAISLLLFGTINIPGIYTTSNYISDQVNQIVESQLNKLTQTTIKNIDISLGIDSYTLPGQSGKDETRTSLSYDIKKDILNDRASIEVSGRLNNINEGENDGKNNAQSNFTFEYRLDSSATKYLHVFKQQSHEDILEGEVERTGIGLIFRKNFNSLKDIWSNKKKKKKAFYPNL